MPRALASLSPKKGVPWVAIVLLASAALMATFFGGLESIINASVFMLVFVYLMTCLSAAIFLVQGRKCTKVTRFGGVHAGDGTHPDGRLSLLGPVDLDQASGVPLLILLHLLRTACGRLPMVIYSRSLRDITLHLRALRSMLMR